MPSIASLVDKNNRSFLEIGYIAAAVAALDKALEGAPDGEHFELGLDTSGYAENPRGTQFLLNILPKGLIEWRGYEASGKVLEGEAFAQALTKAAREMNGQAADEKAAATRVALRVNLQMLRAQA